MSTFNQSTDTLLMVRPVSFRMNEQTAVNNYYQKVMDEMNASEVQDRALEEFDRFVGKLRANGINVIVIEDTKIPDTPDSIFPNNWISFHECGTVGLYPMFAENRRAERRDDFLEILEEKHNLEIKETANFTHFEEHNIFLEGTGSIVLDRVNRVAFAALSQRTDERALKMFCEEFDFDPIVFNAYQTVGSERLPIYHTNVIMCVGDHIAVICADCIDIQAERNMVISKLEELGKTVVLISEDQVNRFAGNMLEVRNDKGELFLVMSQSAHTSLDPNQIKQIEKHYTILSSSLDTIEACGGGSARCMMAEVFLPKA